MATLGQLGCLGLLGGAVGLIAVALSFSLSIVRRYREQSASAQFFVVVGFGVALESIWLPELLRVGVGVAGVVAGFVGLCIAGIAEARSGA